MRATEVLWFVEVATFSSFVPSSSLRHLRAICKSRKQSAAALYDTAIPFDAGQSSEHFLFHAIHCMTDNKTSAPAFASSCHQDVQYVNDEMMISSFLFR